MKRTNNVLHTPVRLTDLSFEDYFDEEGQGAKSQRVQIKAWRKLKHQLS
jgi:hypothetical protein